MESTVHIEAFEALKADYTLVHQRADAAEKEVDRYRKKLSATEEQVAQLVHQLSQLKRLVFGVKSERFVPGFEIDQLPLFERVPVQDLAPATTETITYTKRKKQKPVRRVLPSHLPREVIIIEPGIDTTGMKRIGEQVTEGPRLPSRQTQSHSPGTAKVRGSKE